MSKEVWLRIEAPHYVAAIISQNGIIVNSAPILSWTRGRSLEYVLNYLKMKKYKVQTI